MTEKLKIDDRILEEVIAQVDPKTVMEKGGLFDQMKKRLIEKMLEAEMKEELGYERHSREIKENGNRRNGSYEKTIIDKTGHQMKIEVPRDREGTYEPKLVPKGLRRIEGFDDQVISMYARGMTMSEIQGHLEEIYSVEVSKDLISRITEEVMDEVVSWQNRPLEATYPIIYLDCIHVKARDGHTVINKAVYLALAVNMEGKKELLGMWISKNEGAKFWMQVVTELKNRGVQEIYIACVDGLKGFSDAINTVFPKTTVQLCIVHMVRNSSKYVSYRDLKAVTSDLKKIYTASTEELAVHELRDFAEKWDDKYPVISDIWKRNWTGISPFFAFPDHIRKAIYTTNAIESANRQIRKIIKNKGVFPDDKAISKSIYLALRNASKKWTMPIKNWPLALNQFQILCSDSMDENFDLVTKMN